MSSVPEYCFLWISHWSMCMDKSQWASWAQAIGTVAAVGAALAIPTIEERKQRNAARFAVISSMATAISATGLIKGASLRERAPADVILRLLNEAMDLAVTARLDLLPPAALRPWSQFKATLHGAIAATENIRELDMLSPAQLDELQMFGRVMRESSEEVLGRKQTLQPS